MSVLAFLALGANLGDPVRQIGQALEALDARGLRIERRARLYRSPPLGPPGQPDYVNTAVQSATGLEPLAVLDAAQAVESALGRTPGVRWGPRVIDVDLALYGDVRFAHPRLVVPHRELANRRFVLQPLADLAPELEVPGTGRTVLELLFALPDDPDALVVLDDRVLDRGALFEPPRPGPSG